MTARYYYWTEIKRIRFDDVLKILADREFFIEERTVSNVLVGTQEQFSRLVKEEADSRRLRGLYPAGTGISTRTPSRRSRRIPGCRHNASPGCSADGTGD